MRSIWIRWLRFLLVVVYLKWGLESFLRILLMIFRIKLNDLFCLKFLGIFVIFCVFVFNIIVFVLSKCKE